MASPQLENGYIQIANELYTALYCVDLNGAEFRVFSFIMHMTYGYKRKFYTLSATYIAEGANIPVKTVRRALKSLVAYNMIISRGQSNKIKAFSINKNYEKWVDKNGVQVLKNGVPKNEYPPTQKWVPPSYPKMSTQTTQKWVPNKNNIKNNKHNCLGEKLNCENDAKTTKIATKTKPTKTEIKNYCDSKNYSFDCDKFYNHYDAYDWKYKGVAVDWKKLADRWNERERPHASQNGYSRTKSYDVEEYENYSMFDEVAENEM